MKRSLATLVCVVALSLTSLACQKMEERNVGEIEVSRAVLTDTIPAEFGRLVGTASSGDEVQLIFERADRAIVIVPVGLAREYIADRVFIIPRK